MAARNPTDFNRYVAERSFVPGEPVLEAEIDKAYSDQVYILDAQQLAISDCWYRTTITSAAAFSTAGSVAAQLVRHWYVDIKDMCDVSGVVSADGIACAVYVLAWIAAGGARAAQIRGTTGASTNNQKAVAITATTPTWHKLDDINFRTNDTEEEFILEGRISSGPETLYVAGLGVYAKET